MPGHAVDGVEVLQGGVVQLGAPQQRVEGGGHLLHLPGLGLGLHRHQVCLVQPRSGPVQVSAAGILMGSLYLEPWNFKCHFQQVQDTIQAEMAFLQCLASPAIMY